MMAILMSCGYDFGSKVETKTNSDEDGDGDKDKDDEELLKLIWRHMEPMDYTHEQHH